MATFRIIRRAFSKYATVEIFEGSRLAAELRAMELQASRADGEYLVRKADEPNWIPGAASQSGFDFL